jgi:hypothetical protein
VASPTAVPLTAAPGPVTDPVAALGRAAEAETTGKAEKQALKARLKAVKGEQKTAKHRGRGRDAADGDNAAAPAEHQDKQAAGHQDKQAAGHQDQQDQQDTGHQDQQDTRHQDQQQGGDGDAGS